MDRTLLISQNISELQRMCYQHLSTSFDVSIRQTAFVRLILTNAWVLLSTAVRLIKFHCLQERDNDTLGITRILLEMILGIFAYVPSSSL